MAARRNSAMRGDDIFAGAGSRRPTTAARFAVMPGIHPFAKWMDRRIKSGDDAGK
jgi:hypothetical protein